MKRRPLRRGEAAPTRWTPEQVRTLTMAVGSFGLSYVCRNVSRSPAAVYAKINTTFGGGGIGRGTLSLSQASERTGYNRRQLERAGQALGQRWQRTSTHGRVMLSEDQVEALVRWLGRDYWCSRSKTYACAYCGRDDVPPHGLGLCRLCYQSLWTAFREAALPFGRGGLLGIVRTLQRRTAPEARDWLDAFEASLESGCVLTRGTLDRLLEAATGLGGLGASGEGDSARG